MKPTPTKLYKSFPAKRTLLNHLTRATLGLVAAIALFFTNTNANAACGEFLGAHSNSHVQSPVLGQFLENNTFGANSNTSIVGLWHVIYTTNGSTFNDTFDTWHSDGTEFESAYLAPAGGNVCVGVWKQTALRSVSLHHVGWLFNPSNPTGNATNYFTLDETNTVATNGQSYSGNFTFKIWNLDGSFTGTEVTGSIAATRITPN